MTLRSKDDTLLLPLLEVGDVCPHCKNYGRDPEVGTCIFCNEPYRESLRRKAAEKHKPPFTASEFIEKARAAGHDSLGISTCQETQEILHDLEVARLTKKLQAWEEAIREVQEDAQASDEGGLMTGMFSSGMLHAIERILAAYAKRTT